MRVRTLGILACALGGVFALYLSGQVWVSGVFVDPVLGPQPATVSGADATPASALSLVVLAGLASSLLTSGWGRRIGVLITAAAGLGIAVSALLVLLDPASALSGGLAGSINLSGEPDDIALAWRVWAALAAGIIAAAGAVAFWLGRPPQRTAVVADSSGELTATQNAEAARRQQVAAWDDLSEGSDPTTKD